jgi:hypothetical protein
MTETCRAMIKACEAIRIDAARQRKSKRFRNFAAAMPDEILRAAIDGTESLRHNNFDHEFNELIWHLGISVRGLLFGDDAVLFRRKSTKEILNPPERSWGLEVGLGLVVESYRRNGFRIKVPVNPFSRWQAKLNLLWIMRQAKQSLWQSENKF